MLAIGIGILVAIGFIVLAIVLNDSGVAMPFTLLATVSILIGIFVGIFVPVKYGEWELVNETELVSLSNSTVTEGGGVIYVSMSAENTYTYRYKISSEFGTETSTEYEVDTISGNVIESEDKNCEVPVLKEYVRKGKMTIWTFGLGREEKYVFYVPENTIAKDVKLK